MGINPKIFCLNCIHFDNINFCKMRRIFIKRQKARYCQDYVDKSQIPQPVKPIEEVPVVKEEVPVVKEEIKPEVKVEVKRIPWWTKLLKKIK